MSHWKLMNIYCTFLQKHTSTKSQAQTLVSFHWEGIKERRQRRRFLHLNKYLHPTHYINNMTFTIYSHKRFVLKEGRTFSVGMLFFFDFFFLPREDNCICFSICPFFNYYKYYCAAGWMATRSKVYASGS